MNSSTICSLFLGLILISQSPFAANAKLLGLGGGGVPLVSLICAASSNKVECSKVLSSPQIAQAKNYKELSKAITEIAIKKAVEGEAFLKGLAQKSKSEALNRCAISYSSIVGNFHSCLNFIAGDPETISYDCQLAADKHTECESAMAANARLLDLGGGGVPLVSLLCGRSSNKVECSKVLSSPQTTQAKNYKQLGKAITDIAMKKAVEGEAFLKGLAQKNPKLQTCAGSYSSVVRNFKDCLDFIAGDPDTI